MKKLFILLILCGLHLQISAQQESEDTLKYQLNQVTVSATRYTENILEIPYAVSIITKSQLVNLKGYGIDEALASVPGVLAQSRSGNQDVRIVIRGFGARGAGDRSNSGTTRGIRIMLDGLPETEPDGRTSFDQIDMRLAENVEVIRSNSSAIWGNAAGGVINISSVPDFKEYYVSASGLAGSYGLKGFTLRSGTMLGLAKVYASFANTSFSGWRDHSSSNRSIVNAGVVAPLGTRSQLGVYLLATSNSFHIPGPLTQDEFDADPVQANPFYKARDERRYNRLGRIGVTLEHEIDNIHSVSAMVFVNPKYLQRSERNTFRDFTRYHLGGNVMYKNVLQLSETLKNTLVAGVDEAYQDGAILFYSLSPTNGRGNKLSTNKREGANTFGAFLQSELNIGEDVSILVGGRFDNITYYSEDFLQPKFGMQEKSYQRFTPKAGVTYRFNPTHSVYANLGGGIEVPAGNETDPAGTYGQDTMYLLNPLLEPIKSTTFEVGTKQIIYLGQRSFLNSLTYDVAAYFISVKDDIIPYRGGRFYFTAGETQRMGIELGTQMQLSYGISLQGSVTYSNNKYNSYRVDSVHYSLAKAGKYADYKDNKVAGIPDMFYSASINYAPSFLGGLSLGVTFNGMGAYFVDDANSIEVPSYNIINASLSLNREVQIGGIGLRGFFTVNNITDQRYAASGFINPDLVGGKPVFLEPGMPRNVTLSLMVSIR